MHSEPSRTSGEQAPGGARRRHVSRRLFLSLAGAGLLAGCQKERIVYVSSTPTPAPTAAPAATATPAPKPEEKPAAQPTPNRSPLQMPAPVIAPPIPGVSAQSQILPALQMRDHPYSNRLQPPERLQIPSIGLDSKIIQIGTKTDAQGHFLWETAAFAVGYHKGTALPGDAGNVVLSGHISSPREGAIFNKLPQVEPGDGIVVSTADRQYLYVVSETKVVTPDAVEVLDPTDEAIVTMLTCVPDGIYSHRLVVRAEAV
jgi:sortase A